jgi:hypothetical protein
MRKTLGSNKYLLGITLAVMLLTGHPVLVGAQVPPALLSAEPRKPAPGADELQKLLIARNNAALTELQARGQELQAGRITLDVLLDAARRWRDSALELSEKPAEQMAIRAQILDLAQYIEAVHEAKVNAGTAKIADMAMARYFRIDAEIQLLKLKQKMEKPK